MTAPADCRGDTLVAVGYSGVGMTSSMIQVIEDKREELNRLCGMFHVQRLELFGSASTNQQFDMEDSDLDFLVEFLSLKSGEYFDTYFGLRESLQNLFQRPVDLVMTRAIKNPYFLRSINRSRKVLYAA